MKSLNRDESANMENFLDYLKRLRYFEIKRFIRNADEMHLHIYTIITVAVQSHADMIVLCRDRCSWYKEGEELEVAAFYSEALRSNARSHLQDIVQSDPTVASHMTLARETDDNVAYAIN
jgi:hypothetical protein